MAGLVDLVQIWPDRNSGEVARTPARFRRRGTVQRAAVTRDEAAEEMAGVSGGEARCLWRCGGRRRGAAPVERVRRRGDAGGGAGRRKAAAGCAAVAAHRRGGIAGGE